MGTASFTLDLVITGGTGIFAGDAGSATVTGTITSNSPTTEAISASYLGTLRTTVPEPATLALLGVGLAGLGLSRRKQ